MFDFSTCNVFNPIYLEKKIHNKTNLTFKKKCIWEICSLWEKSSQKCCIGSPSPLVVVRFLFKSLHRIEGDHKDNLLYVSVVTCCRWKMSMFVCLRDARSNLRHRFTAL